ncbi:MAG: phage tail fiber protein [Gemmatimonadota bacterium]
MCPLVDNGKAVALNYLVGKTESLEVTHLALHSSDPGSSGANEVSGGGYSRVAVASGDWDAPSSGELELNTDKSFSTPADQTVHSIGLWSASSGGTFLGYGTPTGDSAANSEGEYDVKSGSKIRLTDS